MNGSQQRQILAAIETATGLRLSKPRSRPASGGCIHPSEVWSCGDHRYFVKTNSAEKLGMFEAELEALEELASADAIRAPRPICVGVSENLAFLVLEAISMQSRGDSVQMGQHLAALHRISSPNGQFGWQRDNAIGETPQPNPWTAGWVEFFATHRISHQLRLAAQRGRKFALTSQLLELIPRFLGHNPEPSLLHGDLWAGNAAFDENGGPVVFDPATYFGDRETDLAFTEMFGGFSSAFYDSYQTTWPLPAGYPVRKRLYNLYHELNHYHLFGGGYGDQAQRTIEWLCRSGVQTIA